MRTFGFQADVIHAHDTFGLMVHGLDLPRVLTIHGFIHEDTRVSGSRFARPRSIIWRYFETRTWAAFPHIISISPYVRERLTGRAPPESARALVDLWRPHLEDKADGVFRRMWPFGGS